MAEEKVSSVVQAKLMPGEVVIGQTRTNISDLVATDKRILRFSSNSFEALDYSDISGIRYGTFRGRKISSRILVVFCDLILIGIAIGVWGAYFDESVRNVTAANAVLISIVCGVFALLSIVFVFAYDYGYYRIESVKIGKNMEKYWSVRYPVFNSARVDKFFQAMSEKGGITFNKKK
ncbi:MAG: hypothetical protein A2Y58_02865 [Chloroflexi bacterium RBG_13_51_52]|nr:MAG: hypothetical protein A2Y58_02865 [Chloroflexi bacterium RBG_13_51_52]